MSESAASTLRCVLMVLAGLIATAVVVGVPVGLFYVWAGVK